MYMKLFSIAFNNTVLFSQIFCIIPTVSHEAQLWNAGVKNKIRQLNPMAKAMADSF